jgi:hypothetical protein
MGWIHEKNQRPKSHATVPLNLVIIVYTYLFIYIHVSPSAVIVYLENISFVYPAMSMMVIGPSLLY